MQIPLHDLSQLLTLSDAPPILDSDTASAPYSSSSPSFPFYPVGPTRATVGIPSPPTYSPSYRQQQLSRQSSQNVCCCKSVGRQATCNSVHSTQSLLASKHFRLPTSASHNRTLALHRPQTFAPFGACADALVVATIFDDL